MHLYFCFVILVKVMGYCTYIDLKLYKFKIIPLINWKFRWITFKSPISTALQQARRNFQVQTNRNSHLPLN